MNAPTSSGYNSVIITSKSDGHRSMPRVTRIDVHPKNFLPPTNSVSSSFIIHFTRVCHEDHFCPHVDFFRWVSGWIDTYRRPEKHGGLRKSGPAIRDAIQISRASCVIFLHKGVDRCEAKAGSYYGENTSSGIIFHTKKPAELPGRAAEYNDLFQLLGIMMTIKELPFFPCRH